MRPTIRLPLVRFNPISWGEPLGLKPRPVRRIFW